MMGLVTPAEHVECVEQAYRMHGEGRYYMDPKAHIVLDRSSTSGPARPASGSRRNDLDVTLPSGRSGSRSCGHHFRLDALEA